MHAKHFSAAAFAHTASLFIASKSRMLPPCGDVAATSVAAVGVACKLPCNWQMLHSDFIPLWQLAIKGCEEKAFPSSFLFFVFFNIYLARIVCTYASYNKCCSCCCCSCSKSNCFGGLLVIRSNCAHYQRWSRKKICNNFDTRKITKWFC